MSGCRGDDGSGEDPCRTSGACGIVLAAGSGTRYGTPKALAVRSDGTPWVRSAVDALLAGGCAPVFVALGAEREAAAALVHVDESVVIVAVPEWVRGISASVRTALAAAGETVRAAAVIVPVDTPDLPAAVVARMAEGADVSALRRAVYDGSPGHPVVIGRRHWPAVIAGVAGDRGAGEYLTQNGVECVECGDLWHGADVDLPTARR